MSALVPVQAQLLAVLELTTREAVRQICRVFRELYVRVAAENTALTDRVRRLDAELRSKVDTSKKSSTQTVYKIKPSGQCNTETSHRVMDVPETVIFKMAAGS